MTVCDLAILALGAIKSLTYLFSWRSPVKLNRSLLLAILLISASTPTVPAEERSDILIADFAGKNAVVEMIDRETGGWGHINIDQIVQSDRPRGVLETVREIVLAHDYLSFRFAPGQGPSNQVRLVLDGKTVRNAVGRGSP